MVVVFKLEVKGKSSIGCMFYINVYFIKNLFGNIILRYVY